jgi:hypothetical protein
MPLFLEKEMMDEDESKIVFEKSQVMYLGLAIQSPAIKDFLLSKGIKV